MEATLEAIQDVQSQQAAKIYPRSLLGLAIYDTAAHPEVTEVRFIGMRAPNDNNYTAELHTEPTERLIATRWIGTFQFGARSTTLDLGRTVDAEYQRHNPSLIQAIKQNGSHKSVWDIYARR